MCILVSQNLVLMMVLIDVILLCYYGTENWLSRSLIPMEGYEPDAIAYSLPDCVLIKDYDMRSLKY
jgi:hypothetical protein